MMKKALLLSVQNPSVSTKLKLSGCYNDVKNWKEILDAKGFESIADKPELDYKESEVQITNFLRSLSADDLGVLFFAGHGTSYMFGLGQIEAFVCRENYLIDKKICSLFKKHLSPNAKLIFISDTCHSGGYFDILRKDNLELSDFGYVSRYHKPENMNPIKQVLQFTNMLKSVFSKNKPCQMDNVMWLTACGANDNAYERPFDNKEVNGVFSYHCTNILRSNLTITYRDLKDKTREVMSHEIKRQVPNINSNRASFLDEVVFT